MKYYRLLFASLLLVVCFNASAAMLNLSQSATQGVDEPQLIAGKITEAIYGNYVPSFILDLGLPISEEVLPRDQLATAFSLNDSSIIIAGEKSGLIVIGPGSEIHYLDLYEPVSDFGKTIKMYRGFGFILDLNTGYYLFEDINIPE